MIVAARASDREVHLTSPYAPTNSNQGSVASQNGEAERRGSTASQTVGKSTEPSAANALPDEQNANGANNSIMGNNPMMMNGMAGQMGYGFNSGMGFGMSNMNGMSNMMGNGNWNGMNSMGMSLYSFCSSTLH